MTFGLLALLFSMSSTLLPWIKRCSAYWMSLPLLRDTPLSPYGHFRNISCCRAYALARFTLVAVYCSKDSSCSRQAHSPAGVRAPLRQRRVRMRKDRCRPGANTEARAVGICWKARAAFARTEESAYCNSMSNGSMVSGCR